MAMIAPVFERTADLICDLPKRERDVSQPPERLARKPTINTMWGRATRIARFCAPFLLILGSWRFSKANDSQAAKPWPPNRIPRVEAR